MEILEELPPRFGAPIQRVMKRATRSDNGCLIFTGSEGGRGYGVVAWNGKRLMAHRVVWEAVNGAIPADMTIDHVCGQKRCVEVSHLRLLTRGANVRAHYHEQASMCRNGKHDLSQVGEWTTIKGNPSLRCRECFEERKRRYKEKRRAS